MVFLESEGYTATVANNVEEGLRHIAHAEPAVVLLEATLPEMSVSTALERIQRDHRDVIVEVAKALKVDLRTFRKYSPHQEGNFPEHYTLF